MTREKRKIAAEEFKEWRDSYYNKNKLPATMFIEEVIKILEQEPCEDAISRQAVQDYIAKYLSQYLYDDVREAVEVIDEYIGELPPVNPQEPKTEQEDDYFRKIVEVAISQLRADRDRLEDELAKREQEPKTGHWMIVYRKGIYTHLVCDKCLSNAPYDCRTNYCPNCGAKMESKENENE